jgi:intein/homing endonuclease
VNPNNRILSPYSGIEPPLWAGLIAGDYLKQGKTVYILDAEALDMSVDNTVREIRLIKPQKIIIVAMGNNPSVSSTPKMVVTKKLVDRLIGEFPLYVTGLHPSALPHQTKDELGIEVLRGKIFEGTPDIPFNLLPMSKYRAHIWQCLDGSPRSPYASVYTSLNCPFSCDFCNIKPLYNWSNRVWYRDIGLLIKEIDLLVNKYGVRNIKFWDEMFTLNKNRVNEICDKIIERHYDLNIWAYARVDSVTPELLVKMRQAGVKWVAYGYESGCDDILGNVEKKATKEKAMMATEWAHNAGMNIIGNFICLPKGEKIFIDNMVSIPINETKVGMNCLTSDGNYHNITEVFNREYEGKIYSIKTRGLLDIKMTPEHPILYSKKVTTLHYNYTNGVRTGVSRYDNPDKPMWGTPKDLHLGDYLLVPKYKYASNDNYKIDLTKYIAPNNKSVRTKVPQGVEVDEDLAYLFGWYVAEGCSRITKPKKWRNKKPTSFGVVQFALGYSENEKAELLAQILRSKFNLKVKLYRPKYKTTHSSLCVLTWSQILARFFRDNFGINARTKIIPSFIQNSRADVCLAFLKGLFEGDGHLRAKKRLSFVLSTSSEQLAYQTILLLNKCGLFATLRYVKREGNSIICGNKTYIHDRWLVSLNGKNVLKIANINGDNKFYNTYREDENYFYVQIQKIETSNYKGQVYNIKTNDGTFNAPFCTVHNCGLPGDTQETMQRTLDFAKSLNLEFGNFYHLEKLPGSSIYDGNKNWSSFGQYSANQKGEAVEFCNKAYKEFFTDKNYLSNLKRKFGQQAVDQINAMIASGKPKTVGET